MIKLGKAYASTDNLILLVDKATKKEYTVDQWINQPIEAFMSNEEKFDFIKLGTQTIFLVDANQNLEALRVAGHSIREKLPVKSTAISLIGDGKEALALAEGLELSNYQFLKYFKDADDKEYALEDIFVIGQVTEADINALNNVIKAVYWARDMVNEPTSYLTATQLGKELEELGKEANIEVEVFKKGKIETLKMGGLIAVNRGSIEPPTFTVMEYKPENPSNEKPLVLVGKGIVYDTGGLSLKPTANSMDEMKSDMGGAACMAGAIYAAALNKSNKHIIALIPSTDNRPGENAYAPGDVITMYDGTTVEVLNTDAEGRMVLADAIAYANQFDPELIIDAATLTGAALVAVGTRAICLMSTADGTVNDALKASGQEVYERLVELPLWDDYKEQIKSTIADLKNIGGSYAGTITAGKFLEHFTTHPFVHLDIAGPAYHTAKENYKGLGGSGVGVRLLADFIAKN